MSAVREGPWKLIRVADNPLMENRELLAPLILLNIDNDPAETTNLAARYPDKVKDLSRKIIAWEEPPAGMTDRLGNIGRNSN